MAGIWGAAGQVWPAFVLVTGLLLVGVVAEQDGLFAAAGAALARAPEARASPSCGRSRSSQW